MPNEVNLDHFKGRNPDMASIYGSGPRDGDNKWRTRGVIRRDFRASKDGPEELPPPKANKSKSKANNKRRKQPCPVTGGAHHYVRTETDRFRYSSLHETIYYDKICACGLKQSSRRGSWRSRVERICLHSGDCPPSRYSYRRAEPEPEPDPKRGQYLGKHGKSKLTRSPYLRRGW